MSRKVSFVYVPPPHTVFSKKALRGTVGQRIPVTTDEGTAGFGIVVDARVLEDGNVEITVDLDDDAATRVLPTEQGSYSVGFKGKGEHRGPVR